MASEVIITKFKSQGLFIIRIKYQNASGSGFPPSIIPALRNIGILLHKQATWIKRVYLVTNLKALAKYQSKASLLSSMYGFSGSMA